ncbi:Trehalose synthase/amylase TreS [Microbacterium sp. 8M]|uniref:alpha-amylase family protein n=1 Tax=Microbacterium sp. 8M TaxID=2653153 RepID=UPI0012F2937A|nr:alpha-amylase family protein [Microbacterium sp. 8M]VXC28871.1 Trehalose synthase/amylase TreS [Microbacterium sp. 8M]
MRAADLSDLWWRTAVIYCLDAETFQDSDGDGIGDFQGLSERVEYLAELGVTCIWLMPFQPTPNRDDGYDVIDPFGIDPRLGTAGDFVEFLRTAHDRGIRVITDLVINHTSDEHRWFREARSSRDNPFRDYYIWSDRPSPDPGSVFPGEEDGTWTWDERTGQYYQHSFYRHQPDLNLANPDVRGEIARVVGYWLALGIDGFRIDAVPFLTQAPGAADDKHPHAFLRELRRFIGRRRGGVVLLGEVGLDHDGQLPYFGDPGTELDLQFDFSTMSAAMAALATHRAAPLARALTHRPSVDASQGWCTFLRNHDELNLELATPEERDSVFAAFAPDERTRVYGRGVVRRLAPMLDGDMRRLRLAYAVLFSLPGAPMLYYGEEIGMGEAAPTGQRLDVRTPMQWQVGPAAGFSSAADRLVRPLPEGDYGPDRVNVRSQRNDPESLHGWIRHLISRYRATPEIVWGRTVVLDAGDPRILAHAAVGETDLFLALHNLADQSAQARIEWDELTRWAPLRDLLASDRDDIDASSGRVDVELDGYEGRWLRAGRAAEEAR